MSNPKTGGCLCGVVRYEISVEPKFAGNCHCRDCQKSSGGPYVPAMFMADTGVKISGEVKYFKMTVDSGNQFSRGFCPNCGSALFGISSGMPGLIGVRAGTLDDPSAFKPLVDIFVGSAQHWDTLNPALPKFNRNPQ